MPDLDDDVTTVPDEEVEDTEADTVQDDKTQEGKPAGWDKDRQKRDQDRAEKVKNLESGLEGLKAQVQDLPNQILKGLVGRISDSATQKTEQDKPDGLQEVIARLNAVNSEDVDFDKLWGAVKDVAHHVSATTQGKDTVIAELKDELAKLGTELADEKKRNTERDEREDQQQADKRYNDLLASLDKQYAKGKSILRVDAIDLAQEELGKMGFDGDSKLPPESTVTMALKLAYREVAEKKDREQKEKEASGVTLDSIQAGATASGQKSMSLIEKVAQMRREGRLTGH